MRQKGDQVSFSSRTSATASDEAWFRLAMIWPSTCGQSPLRVSSRSDGYVCFLPMIRIDFVLFYGKSVFRIVIVPVDYIRVIAKPRLILKSIYGSDTWIKYRAAPTLRFARTIGPNKTNLLGALLLLPCLCMVVLCTLFTQGLFVHVHGSANSGSQRNVRLKGASFDCPAYS